MKLLYNIYLGKLAFLGVTVIAINPPVSKDRTLVLKGTNVVEATTNPYESEYIVRLDDPIVTGGNAQVASIAESLLAPFGEEAEVMFMYTNVFYGFAAKGLPDDFVSAIQKDKRVKTISQNDRVEGYGTQLSPSWHLDRIDQSYRPLDSSYSYNATGNRVSVYVLDSGIMANHSEFQTSAGKSRVKCGFTAFPDEGCEDFHGHGTHVAGVVAGKTFGVAKSAHLVNVKVLDFNKSGSVAGIIAGIEYVIEQKKKNRSKPMVINMSLGGPKNALINKAVSRAVQSRIFVVVSAGSNEDNACGYSPASAKEVVTVAATDMTDNSTEYNNEGPCVSIFAPGVNIVSASITCTTCKELQDGTSQAAALVSGVGAQVLQKYPKMAPFNVWATIKRAATEDIITPYVEYDELIDGTPNLLLKTIF